MWRMDAHVACAVPSQIASLRVATHATRWEGCAPERSASARVQETGGAVAMIRGELVFDGVAISDTSATVRRPLDARRSALGPPATCGGGPAPDRWRVQGYGGAVYMDSGAVTFRGNSSILRTQAVRPALPRAHMHARTWSTSLRRWHWHWQCCLI